MLAITKKKGNPKRGFFKTKNVTDDSGRHVGKYKYSGAKLKEKGVLMKTDIEIPLKLITVEISCEEVGYFTFKGTALGKAFDAETIAFADLLENQYNNVTTFKMFEYCTINVNLLIFLINKKFYNK